MAKTTCSIDGCGRSVDRRGWCTSHYSRWWRNGDPLAGGTLKGEPLAFLKSVAEGPSTAECIVWPHQKTTAGYGQLRVGGTQRYAHRLILEMSAGKPPETGMHAAHAPEVCHNPSCINPRHLRWASATGNAADRLADDTHNRGERCGTSKLTESEVLEIYASGESQQVLASRYGVSQSAVSFIKLGKRWGWLTQSSELDTATLQAMVDDLRDEPDQAA